MPCSQATWPRLRAGQHARHYWRSLRSRPAAANSAVEPLVPLTTLHRTKRKVDRQRYVALGPIARGDQAVVTGSLKTGGSKGGKIRLSQGAAIGVYVPFGVDRSDVAVGSRASFWSRVSDFRFSPNSRRVRSPSTS